MFGGLRSTLGLTFCVYLFFSPKTPSSNKRLPRLYAGVKYKVIINGGCYIKCVTKCLLGLRILCGAGTRTLAYAFIVTTSHVLLPSGKRAPDLVAWGEM